MIVLQFILSKYVPIVLLDSFKEDDSNLKHIVQWVQAGHKDQYTLILDNLIKGNSLSMPVDEQCKKIQELLKTKQELSGGFIAFGQSLGGYVWRHYIEFYNDPPVKRFIAQGSPLGGFYLKDGECFDGECSAVRKDPYSAETQAKHSLANYWRDPKNISEFLKGSASLAKINNLVDFSEQRKNNFKSLDRFVAIGDPNDGFVQPWKSQFFGFYEDGKDVLTDFHQMKEWTDDLFGLKSVTDASKTFMYRSKLTHAQYYDVAKYQPFFNVFVMRHFDWQAA